LLLAELLIGLLMLLLEFQLLLAQLMPLQLLLLSPELHWCLFSC
jgi:hypothetical protein